MDCAYACGCKQGDWEFWDDWEVDCDAVSFFEAVVFEDFGEFVDFAVELVVGVGADFAHFAFPDVGEFVFLGGFYVPV